jgi:hypothetical protein
VRHTLEEEWPSPQNGGSAPVDSIGKDPIPVRHTLEEEWPSPQGGGALSIGTDLEPVKFTPESHTKSQTGGGNVDAFEIVRAETPAPIEPIGTVDFNQATFSQPSMSSEPYVIANPYTSPPLTTDEVKMPAAPTYIQPSSTTLTDAVGSSLLAAVDRIVQQGGSKQEEQKKVVKQTDENVTTVFENSDIRVIKLA